MKIRKGDNVQVMAGKDKGKQGKVERVWLKEEKVMVPGLNLYKKHVKKQAEKPGEIVSIPRPYAVGKVALVCPKCKQITRVGYQIISDKKTRVCRKCNASI